MIVASTAAPSQMLSRSSHRARLRAISHHDPQAKPESESAINEYRRERVDTSYAQRVHAGCTLAWNRKQSSQRGALQSAQFTTAETRG